MSSICIGEYREESKQNRAFPKVSKAPYSIDRIESISGMVDARE